MENTTKREVEVLHGVPVGTMFHPTECHWHEGPLPTKKPVMYYSPVTQCVYFFCSADCKDAFVRYANDYSGD